MNPELKKPMLLKKNKMELYMYVLRRINDNKYVSIKGRDFSYTDYLQYAQKFRTREEAVKNRCIENEYIEEIKY